MPQELSEKQLAANRLNAQCSTGPRTDEGKAHSSQNALKHGLLAREAVITSGCAAENPAEFQSLLAGLRDELQPTGLIQETLVERLATCYWRLRRAQRLEIAAIHDTLDKPAPPTPESLRVKKLLASIDRAVAEIQEDEKFIKKLQHPPDPGDAKKQAKFHSLLTNLADSFDIQTTDQSEKDLCAALIDSLESAIAVERLGLNKLESQLDEARSALYIQQSPGSLPSPRHDTLVRLVRYESMLDRQFHRALTEFRRHQSARSPSKAKN